MADMFTSWRISNLEFPNRIVRSATWEGLADDSGLATDALVSKTAELAQGGVGLIITGFAYVTDDGRAMVHQTGIYKDECIGPLSRMTEAVHQQGGKIAVQIVHGGGMCRREFINGRQAVGPSAMTHPGTNEEVAELFPEKIEEIIVAFGAAAGRARRAGFDAVQLHGAHGYLVNQFLSPDINLRQDDYRGDIEGRARFCYAVYDAARAAVGPDFPIMIKLNSEDGRPGGLTLDDSMVVARRLSDMGIDAIEVSGGARHSGDNIPSRPVKGAEDEGYFLANARAIKEAVSCPVIVVGGWRSPGIIEPALDDVDAVAMCRPLIREPGLLARWHSGDLEPAACISCGRCFDAIIPHGLSCYQELKKEGRV